MPRPDELDRCWYKNDPSAEELHDFWHHPVMPPRDRRMALLWIIPGVIFCALFWWFTAPAFVSLLTPEVNGCEAYRAEMVACAETR